MSLARLVRFASAGALAFAGAAAVHACSSFDSTEGPDAAAPSDATPQDDASGTDAGADASPPPCDPSKAFGEPTVVQGIDTPTNNDGFWILDDGLTAYLTSDRPDAGGPYRLFSATRDGGSDVFGSVTPEAIVDDAGVARSPVVSRDGLTLYFFRGSGGPSKIWMATRGALGDPFGAPSLAPSPLNEGSSDLVTWTGAASIVFSSNRTGADIEVYRSDVSDGGFGAPVAITSLNSVGDDYAVLTPDELQAFVGSSRSGGAGGLDLYYTRRGSTTEDFPPPSPLTNLNSDTTEIPTYVSADGCTLYFKRTTHPFGIYDILVAKRPE